METRVSPWFSLPQEKREGAPPSREEFFFFFPRDDSFPEGLLVSKSVFNTYVFPSWIPSIFLHVALTLFYVAVRFSPLTPVFRPL